VWPAPSGRSGPRRAAAAAFRSDVCCVGRGWCCALCAERDTEISPPVRFILFLFVTRGAYSCNACIDIAYCIYYI